MAFNFQRLEHVRIGLALLAAVITGGAALYGVHTNAREATVASYETLAPEINELKQAVTRLEAQNEELRQRLAGRSADPVIGRADVAAPVATEGRSPPRRPRAPAPPTAGTKGRPEPTAQPSPPQPTEPAPPPEAAPTPAPPPTPAPSGPGAGVLKDIQKRVPIDFEKAKEVWKTVKGVRKE